MNKKQNAVIVFVRNAELGKVKTRLAKSVGNENALAIYKDLLQHSSAICNQVEGDIFVFYSEKIETNDIWETKHKFIQEGNDLGNKMLKAFENIFQLGYQNVLIIGSDCFDLRSKHINEALISLKTKDIVVGPAKDGGYYLLAMKKTYPFLFENKTWSSSSVLDHTIADCVENKLSYNKLEELNDIDTIEDLEAHQIFEEIKKTK